MKYEDLIRCVTHPESISVDDQQNLKELIVKYPYFGIGQWLYLKSLKNQDSVYFEQELKKTALFTPNRRNLYFFIHPEKINATENLNRERNALTGSYFDMIGVLEEKQANDRTSLKSLAAKLREAREMMKTDSTSKNTETTKEAETEIAESTAHTDKNKEKSMVEELEIYAKKCIKEAKYAEAIETYEKLNLINPKKSIYFADQIRFLKKITNN